MSDPVQNIIPVNFTEHIWVASGIGQSNEFDLVLESPFSLENYSTAIFRKLFNIGYLKLLIFSITIVCS